MLKTFASLGALALVLSLNSQANAQALPTATARSSFQVGVGYTIADPDYGPRKIQGPTIFANYDFGLHWGLVADVHIIDLRTPTDIAEVSYMGGARFILPYRQRFKLYGKGLVGAGNFRVLEQEDNQGRFNGTYLAYGFGGGLDIAVNRKLVIRAIDAEYQMWPSYNNNDGLTPMLYTFGVAYHFR